jgi:prepilin-type N-terminal cleavage/methylation domain-containing protein
MKSEHGFSLLELILAVAIFSLSSFALVTMLIDTNIGARQILERIDALSYAREGISKVEDLRSCGYFSILADGSDYSITGDCDIGYQLVSGGETVYNDADEETIYTRTYGFSDYGSSTSIKNFSVTVSWDSPRPLSVSLDSLISDYTFVINELYNDEEVVD